MNHAEKIDEWQKYAKGKGWKSNYPATHEKLVMKLTGKDCPPSFFWPSWALGIMFGFFWGSFWVAFMYFTVWGDKTILQIVIPSLVGGFLFGLGAMFFHLYQKRKHGLTTWDKFIEESRNSQARA